MNDKLLLIPSEQRYVFLILIFRILTNLVFFILASLQMSEDGISCSQMCIAVDSQTIFPWNKIRVFHSLTNGELILNINLIYQ